MKDVFKQLKVLVEKGKVALHKLTKIYWKPFDNIYKYKHFSSTIVADLCSKYYLAPRYRALCKSSC